MLRIGPLAKKLGVCTKTLRRWEKSGHLSSSSRTCGNHRRYDESVLDLFFPKIGRDNRLTLIDARVSSQDQKHDLKVDELISMGSGLNFNKKGFNKWLSMILMTFQTTLNGTLNLTREQMAVLEGRCELMSYLERIYYVDKVTHKKDLNQLKSQYIADYDINARQFNALRIAVDGKIASTLALAKEDLTDTEQALKKAKRKRSGLFKTKEFYEKKAKIKPLNELDLTFNNPVSTKLWYARQRVMKLEAKVKKLKDMIATGNPHICFGGRKLFLQQFQMEGGNNQTRFKTVGQVKKAWKDKRKQQFTLVGSKDETAGNQNCQISHDKKTNSFYLKINVAPKADKLQDRFMTVPLTVYSGQDILLAAMDNQQALTYRF